MNNRFERYPIDIRKKLATTTIEGALSLFSDALKEPSLFAYILNDLQEAALALENIASDDSQFLKAYTVYIQFLALQNGIQLPNAALNSKEELLATIAAELSEDEKNSASPIEALAELNAQITNKNPVNTRHLYLAMYQKLSVNKLDQASDRLQAELQSSNASHYVRIVTEITELVDQNPKSAVAYNKIYQDICQFFTKDKLNQIEFAVLAPLLDAIASLLPALNNPNPIPAIFAKEDNLFLSNRSKSIIQSGDFELMANADKALDNWPSLKNTPFFIDVKNGLRVAMLDQYHATLIESVNHLNRQSPTYQNDVNEIKDSLRHFNQENEVLLKLRGTTAPLSRAAAAQYYLENLQKYSALLQQVHQFDADDSAYLTTVTPIRASLIATVELLKQTHNNEHRRLKRLLMHYFTLTIFYRDAAGIAKTNDAGVKATNEALGIADKYSELLGSVSLPSDPYIDSMTSAINDIKNEINSSDLRLLNKALYDRKAAIESNDYRRVIDIDHYIILALSAMDSQERSLTTALTISDVHADIGDNHDKLNEKIAAIKANKSAIHYGLAKREVYEKLLALIDEQLRINPISLQAASLRHDRNHYQGKLTALILAAPNVSTAAVILRPQAAVSASTATVFATTRNSSAPGPSRDNSAFDVAAVLGLLSGGETSHKRAASDMGNDRSKKIRVTTKTTLSSNSIR